MIYETILRKLSRPNHPPQTFFSSTELKGNYNQLYRPWYFFYSDLLYGPFVDMSGWIVQTAFSFYRINLNLITGAEKITSFGAYLAGGYTLASESGLSVVLLGGAQ